MNFILHWHYKAAKGKSITFRSDWISGDDIYAIIEDLERTGRTKGKEIEDEMGQFWTKKELKKLLAKLDEEPDDIVLYFDGSFDKTSGMAGLGIVLTYWLGSQKLRKRVNQKIGPLESNNEAEAAALFYALRVLEDLNIKGKKVIVRGDSQRVIMSLKEDWPTNDQSFNRWLNRIEEKIRSLKLYPEYELVPRENNKEADKLSTQAILGIQIESLFPIEDPEEKR